MLLQLVDEMGGDEDADDVDGYAGEEQIVYNVVVQAQRGFIIFKA